ncbi:hypothetical protein OAS39_08535 [Pirellulales bacterium]|nr:hypothetical protein [Pirellulales bacterium]
MSRQRVVAARHRVCSAHFPRFAAVGLLLAIVATSAAASDRSSKTIEIAGASWFSDYGAAYRAAAEQGRLLLINFTPLEESANQQTIDAAILAQPSLREQLNKLVLCRLPVDAEIQSDGKAKKLIASGAFAPLRNGPGFVVIDLTDRKSPHFGMLVTVLPFQSGKYYHFSVDGFAAALDLPPGTLTQRTMIWAVRMHPERPASTLGQFDGDLAQGAAQHASYQASVTQQGHQNFESRFHRLSAAAGSSVTEVCAESWPGQTLVDSCVDCVASWRHSSGHWRSVSGRHRAYGYDIRQGRDGIWYATGLFAN